MTTYVFVVTTDPVRNNHVRVEGFGPHRSIDRLTVDRCSTIPDALREMADAIIDSEERWSGIPD